jgi:hypothetical protein
MSDYGRLFARVSEIRDMLKHLVPGAKVNTLGEAIREASAQDRRIQQGLSDWADLEREMAKCDDETGNRR